jgi:hypothetical protein
LFFTDAELILNQVQHMVQHDNFSSDVALPSTGRLRRDDCVKFRHWICAGVAEIYPQHQKSETSVALAVTFDVLSGAGNFMPGANHSRWLLLHFWPVKSGKERLGILSPEGLPACRRHGEGFESFD